MKNRRRNKLKKVFYSDNELEIVYKKMRETGTDNFSAYCRKMTVDGYILKQDFTEMKQLSFEINKIGNNINQIARAVNTDCNVSLQQLTDINIKMEEIWHILKSKILKQP